MRVTIITLEKKFAVRYNKTIKNSKNNKEELQHEIIIQMVR